jgi:methionyl-tRNA formyltransferase
MKILFMGTPEFAVPSLKALYDNGYEIVGVVTQVDRPKDRGHTLKAPPVKEFALAHQIPVFQPLKLSREPEVVEALRALKPDVTVTCAFGQILKQDVLDIPKYGTINIHGSLLPKYRGAAPIQWAVINGEAKTGITTMFTDIGLDTGDMLLKDEIDIPDDMTAGQLHDIMAELGARTLIKTLKALEDGTLKRIKQNDAEATYAPKIEKNTGHIDWSKSSRQIHNLIRGTTPWPGAYTGLAGSRMRIWQSRCSDTQPPHISLSEHQKPGTILALDNAGLWVKTGDGVLLITEIQVDSSKRMTPKQYANGHQLNEGMVLGSNEAS